MRGWTGWSIMLGFALGGFFDGILLHQILQWHHLLSMVPGVGSLRMQLLWDGVFHAAMYLLAILGLWGMWRHRAAGAGWGTPLLGALLLGFGLWHVVDAVLSHWVLGLHRIKLDSPDPLFWDLLWFGVFGLLFLLLGWILLRREADQAPGAAAGLALLLLTGLTSAAGAWAMRPPPDQPLATVVFRPGASVETVLTALAASDARLVWADPAWAVVIVEVPAERRWRFYRHGALLVSASGLPVGCVSRTRPAARARGASAEMRPANPSQAGRRLRA